MTPHEPYGDMLHVPCCFFTLEYMSTIGFCRMGSGCYFHLWNSTTVMWIINNASRAYTEMGEISTLFELFL